jgi:broad specificity phosphatase PhoE
LKHHQEKTIVLVSHTSFLRTLILEALGEPLSAYWRLDIASCSLSQLEITDKKSRATSVNKTDHLLDLNFEGSEC